MSAYTVRTPNELLVFIGGHLVYKRWFDPTRGPAEKTASAFFCPWTGRVVLPNPEPTEEPRP